MQSYSSVVTHSSRFERSDLFHFLPKRQPKPSTDEGYWDCSVCTFKNSAEAFKCSMCDVRKGTSTRPSQGKPPVSITTSKSHPGRPTRSNPSSMKPRPVSQLVAQQVSQQFASPTQPKKEKKDKGEKEKNEKETVSKKNSHKKTRPRLKNVDRSSAQHLEVTVGDLTVIITDFKEKARSAPAATATSSTTADQHSLSSSSSDNTEKGLSRSSSPRGEGSVNGESH
ncbi:YY1-associated factor 2 isoform X8 [Scyliorhinus torazame]|uniref:YY1-associated factor 2 isoform X8 n=2 Tax=Scyliorhinus torazame TaxID=75743 RepID=UPI003B5C3455